MGAVSSAQHTDGHGFSLAAGAGGGAAAVGRAGRTRRLCVLRRLRRRGATAAVLPAGLGGDTGRGRCGGSDRHLVRRREPDPPGFFGQPHGSGIDPRHHRRYTGDRQPVSGADTAENGGIPAVGVGVGGPGEAEDRAPAAGGAGDPGAGVQRAPGHRVLPAAGQRAGGWLFSQPGTGGGGRGKGRGAGKLDGVPEAG